MSTRAFGACICVALLAVSQGAAAGSLRLQHAVSPLPPRCPESGILTLEAGIYFANSTNIGNCTLVGKPGVEILGHVVFDHGEINGTVNFEGSGKSSSCVSGAVKINGENVNFNGCDMGFPRQTEFHIHGGNVSFTHGGQVCGLNIHSGNVRVVNISGCQWVGSPWIVAGPGLFYLDMVNVSRYGGLDIEGGFLRLEGSIEMENAVHLKDSVVHFVNWRPTTRETAARLDLTRVNGTGELHFQALDHSYHSLSGCRFNDFNFSVSMQRGGGRFENTTWLRGSYDVRWAGPLGGMGVDITGSQIEAVDITGRLFGPLHISDSSIRRGGMRMTTYAGGFEGASLELANSRVELSNPTAVVVAGSIRVASSTLFLNGVASGALQAKGSLEVKASSLAFVNVTGGSPVNVQGDVSMLNSNFSTTNCSDNWLSQATMLLLV